MLKFNEKSYFLTETIVEGKDYNEVKEARATLCNDDYNCQTIQKGYENGEEESKVFWFKAEKKVLQP